MARMESRDRDNERDPLIEAFRKEEDSGERKVAVCITLWLTLGTLLLAFPDKSRARPSGEPLRIEHRTFEFTPPTPPPAPTDPHEILTVPAGDLPPPPPRDVEPMPEAVPEPTAEFSAGEVDTRLGPKREPPRERAETNPISVGLAGLVPPALIEGTQQQPSYTPCARRLGLSGKVILRAVINSQGRVRSVKVLKGIERCGLNDQAIQAVQQWRYRPGLLEGRPVDVVMTVHLSFTID